MHEEDEIEIYCEYCNAKYSLPFDESFQKKEIRCYSCNRIYYWIHCPKCETGFTSKFSNPKCIECDFGIDIQKEFEKGSVAFTGTTGINGTNIQFPFRDIKSVEDNIAKAPNFLQFLFYLQCPICGRWHLPIDGMGKVPIMCKCGVTYYVRCGYYMIIFFAVLLMGAYLYTFFPDEYKTKTMSIIYFIIMIIINFIIAPRMTFLEKYNDEK